MSADDNAALPCGGIGVLLLLGEKAARDCWLIESEELKSSP